MFVETNENLAFSRGFSWVFNITFSTSGEKISLKIGQKLIPKVENLFPTTILPGFFLLGFWEVYLIPKPTDVFYSFVVSPRKPSTAATHSISPRPCALWTVCPADLTWVGGGGPVESCKIWSPFKKTCFLHNKKTEKDLKTSIPLKFVEGSVSEHL